MALAQVKIVEGRVTIVEPNGEFITDRFNIDPEYNIVPSLKQDDWVEYAEWDGGDPIIITSMWKTEPPKDIAL